MDLFDAIVKALNSVASFLNDVIRNAEKSSELRSANSKLNSTGKSTTKELKELEELQKSAKTEEELPLKGLLLRKVDTGDELPVLGANIQQLSL
ncbi:hypothetical protein MP228_012354 [Amoeboaphelidium protococcarum]|nr:hypothetical protein MP228_012354 [Amoeboaphelidium protococcarum]